MNNLYDEEVRFEELRDKIEEAFADENFRVATIFETKTTSEEGYLEMFEVEDVQNRGSFLKLKHLFEDHIYYARLHHPGVAELIRKGDVFLMMLTPYQQDLWKVSYMSPPYDTFYGDEDFDYDDCDF